MGVLSLQIINIKYLRMYDWYTKYMFIFISNKNE